MVETKTTKYGSYMIMDQKRIHDHFCEWAATAKDHETKTMLVKCRHITDDSDVRIPVGYSVSMYPEEVSRIMWFVLATMLDDPRTFG